MWIIHQLSEAVSHVICRLTTPARGRGIGTRSMFRRKTSDRCLPKAARRGLTLVEVSISTLLVGFLVVASLKSVGGVVRTWQVTAGQKKAPDLAWQLMTEVLQAPYEDPEDPGGSIGLDTGETGTTRADFDDVDDYDGWNKTNPQNKDGTAQTAWTGWQRTVQIQYVNPDTLSVSGTDTGLKQITATVIAPDATQTVIEVLRSRWGALERPTAVDTTVVTWVGGELQIGSSAAAHVSGNNVHNHANDE